MDENRAVKAKYGWYHKKMNIIYLIIGGIGLSVFFIGFFSFFPLNIILLIAAFLVLLLFLWPALGLTAINLMKNISKTHPVVKMKEIISLEKPKILDIGCGTGKVAITMAKNLQKGGEVYGIDIFSDAISNNDLKTVESNASAEGVKDITTFKFGSATEIPYENNYFDIVNVSYVLHEVRDKEKALKEISRVLKPEGKLYLCEFNRNSSINILVNGIYFMIFSKKKYWMDLLIKTGFKNIEYLKKGAIGLFVAS